MIAPSREETLYHQVETALSSYAETAKILEQQKEAAAALLTQAEQVIDRGENLFRKLLEQRRRMERLMKDTQGMRQAVNRECQGLQDSLELHRQRTNNLIRERSVQLQACLERVEKDLLRHRQTCNRRILWVALICGTACAFFGLLIVR